MRRGKGVGDAAEEDRPETEIVGQSLTTFEVRSDGGSFRLNMIDADGKPAAVTLPSDCLNELLLTVPRIVLQTLRARYNDETMRLVYPLEHWKVEVAEDGQLILTMGTKDGFDVSFVARPDVIEQIADAASGEGGRPLRQAIN